MITGTLADPAGRSARMALARVDTPDEPPVLFGPSVNADAVGVGWAPDSTGFAVVAPTADREFECIVFSRDAAVITTVSLPNGTESTQAVLSPGARFVAIGLRGNLVVFDPEQQRYLAPPAHLRERNAISAVGWLADGRLALTCIGQRDDERDLVFLSVPGWEGTRSAVSRDLGGVVAIHPSGSPWLMVEQSACWYRCYLMWASGVSERLSAQGPTRRPSGIGWVPVGAARAE